MKHFVVEVTYKIPAEELGEILPLHRAFLKTGYEKGWLLASGPQVPRTGGLIIARAPSLEELEAFFTNDPYQKNDVATYRFIEFQPVLHHDLLNGWVD